MSLTAEEFLTFHKDDNLGRLDTLQHMAKYVENVQLRLDMQMQLNNVEKGLRQICDLASEAIDNQCNCEGFLEVELPDHAQDVDNPLGGKA